MKKVTQAILHFYLAVSQVYLLVGFFYYTSLIEKPEFLRQIDVFLNSSFTIKTFITVPLALLSIAIFLLVFGCYVIFPHKLLELIFDNEMR